MRVACLPDTMTVDGSSGGGVSWPAAVDAAVIADSERHYPDECCGLLFGTADGHVVSAQPIANAEDPERRRAAYLLSPRAYREAEQAARSSGLDIVGVFHSHPDHPAVPSPTDLAAAWPDWLYVIVPVVRGQAGRAAGWRLRDDRSGFDPVTLRPTE